MTTQGPPVCIVSIVRSGDILQEAVRTLQPGLAVGKILVQRDETKPDKPAVLYYKKLPPNINQSFVILVDPMLATAGSALRAISVLKVMPFLLGQLFQNIKYPIWHYIFDQFFSCVWSNSNF